jgi:hypothetical protein
VKCYSISDSASSIYSRLKSTKDNANWSLNIDPPWMIPIENDDNFSKYSALLMISGKVEVRNSQFIHYIFTLSIVVENCIVRRFHIDVDTGISKILKPKCHLQYGGEAHELKNWPELKYGLEPWIEKPRFPFPPFDIILLFDLILRQFNTSISRKFVEETKWRDLLKESENFRLKDYFSLIHQYFENINDEKRTLFEKLCY